MKTLFSRRPKAWHKTVSKTLAATLPLKASTTQRLARRLKKALPSLHAVTSHSPSLKLRAASGLVGSRAFRRVAPSLSAALSIGLTVVAVASLVSELRQNSKRRSKHRTAHLPTYGRFVRPRVARAVPR